MLGFHGLPPPGLTLFPIVLIVGIYIDFDRVSGKQKSILIGGSCDNTFCFDMESESNHFPQQDQPCPRTSVKLSVRGLNRVAYI